MGDGANTGYRGDAQGEREWSICGLMRLGIGVVGCCGWESMSNRPSPPRSCTATTTTCAAPADRRTYATSGDSLASARSGPLDPGLRYRGIVSPCTGRLATCFTSQSELDSGSRCLHAGLPDTASRAEGSTVVLSPTVASCGVLSAHSRAAHSFRKNLLHGDRLAFTLSIL